MKYILLASLLSSAVLAAPAPMAQRGNGKGNRAGAGANANANTAGGATGATAQQAGATGQQGGATGQQGAAGVAPVTPQQAVSNQTPTPGVLAAQQGQSPTSGDLATAVANWMADTSMVSAFLNTGASIQNNVQFKQAALVAYNAEVDELNHKAIIDAANAGQPNVQSANSTLATGGAFQDVVNKLQIMSQQGISAANNIDLINQNRCVNVLPNIDAYMASTGSSSQAVRPTVCDQTGVAGGVQGNGPTLPGQAPGTPQAAFTAAQSLAQGTGNGLVQNGGAQGNGAQAGQNGNVGQAGQAGQNGNVGQAGQAGQNGNVNGNSGNAGGNRAGAGANAAGGNRAGAGANTAAAGGNRAGAGANAAAGNNNAAKAGGRN